MAKILLVEDDKELSEKVKDWLEFSHHSVETAYNGPDARDRMQLCQYDLIILDWMLPDITGIELLKEFRNRRAVTPILMLTGRDSISDKEMGLDSGADDYLTKPFDMRELTARVNALIRRMSSSYDPVLKSKTISVDTRSKQVTKNGTPVKLQPQEIALLEFLMRNPLDVFSVEALFTRVWPSDLEASPDTVRVCITRLRNKLDTEGQPSIIRTVHRIGYQIDLNQ